MKKKLAVCLCLVLLLTSFAVPALAADPVPRVVIDGQQVSFDAAPVIDNGRVLVPLRAIFEQMGARVDWDEDSATAAAVKGDVTVKVTVGSTAPTINEETRTIDVPAQMMDSRVYAPLRFVCEAFGGTVTWDQDTYVASVTTPAAANDDVTTDTSATVDDADNTDTSATETEAPDDSVAEPAEPAAPAEMTVTLQQAVDLAVQNNPQVKLAGVDRDKKAKAYAIAKSTSHKLEYGDTSATYSGKLAIYLNPKITERQAQQAQQVYDITLNGVKVQAESAFYELIKARENEQIAENALTRATEQLNIANTKYAVGEVAKIEVIQNEAAQAAAQAALTSARSNSRQKMLELNQVLGLNMNTTLNTTGTFEFTPESFDLQSLLDKAEQESMSIITAQNNYDIASWTYDFIVSYYSTNNNDARLAKEDVNAAAVVLQQAKDDVVITVNQAYSNYAALEEQYQYLLKTVELSKEAYRMQQLSYEVGMSTFEDVQKASDTLQTAEASLSECIYAYNTLKSSLKYNLYS
ncbi:MAG TPA: stalk domain-containing protein [Syntrophomonas sp.]|nr:stalk domain-containing protein [Syntrophomonas sp.]